MNDFELPLQDFMNDRLDGMLDGLREKNSEYKACSEFERNIVKRFNAILDDMTKEDRNFIESHQMNFFNWCDIKHISGSRT